MEIIKKLIQLDGKWEGLGVSEFPTINKFDYKEELFFTINNKHPIVHFEQKAWIKSDDNRNNEPISWESGFIADKGNNMLELVCAHNSGRLEWYRGFANQITETTIEIEFYSVAILNDDRMINSKRFYRLSAGAIEYEQAMRTVKVQKSTKHLSAKLIRH